MGEVLIKGGEKLGKHNTGKTVVVNKGSKGPTTIKQDHPDKEIAAKLIKTNQELTMKLQTVNNNFKKQPNNGAVITVLKAQVKELQAKKTPKATAVIKKAYAPPPPPAPKAASCTASVCASGTELKANAGACAGKTCTPAECCEAKKAKKAAPKKAAPAPAPTPKTKVEIVKEKVYITPAPTVKPNCHKESTAKHPFAGLEKNVKQIMKLKGGVEKAQKMVVAAKLTLKDRESEICDKSRKASELSNKHQTHFWVGMVKEVRSKVSTKPPTVDHGDWKNKLSAAVHNDVQRMAGIKAVDYLQ